MTQVNSSDLETGVVISSHRNRIVILDKHRQSVGCLLRHGKQRVVSGDWVQWKRLGSTTGRVENILPRTSLVYKPGERRHARPVAANVNRLVLVLAPIPAYLTRLIDRYLVTAAYFGISPCLVFNKIDLLDKASLGEAKAALNLYTTIDIPCFWISATTGAGIDDFTLYLASQNTILVGQSGVGKSSITKCLVHDSDIAVQRLSSRGASGRHTTSRTTLYPLERGGWIMDSPGVRNFALWQIPLADIAGGFSEFTPFLGECRFRDCRHDVELGCAIIKAVNDGVISTKRLASYREMINEPQTR